MIVLITGVTPQAIYGADDDEKKSETMLTSDEEKFFEDWKRLNSRLDGIIVQMRTFDSYGYMNFQKDLSSKSASELIREKKRYLDFEAPCQLNTAPSTLKYIQTEWNTKVCSQYGKIRLAIEAALVPSITKESWLALGNKIDSDIDLLFQMQFNVRGMIIDRITELQQQRKKAGINPKAIEKEVKEEVKKEQSKKDGAGKPDGDSDDLFDFDCFIATAAYGTPAAKEIDELRQFRDEYLRESYLGNEFIKFYYSNSPPIADFISKHEVLRVVVKEGFVDPIVKIVELTENWWAE